MYTPKKLIILFIVICTGSILTNVCQAIDTQEIEYVYKMARSENATLSQSDYKTVDDFWVEALDQMLSAEKHSDSIACRVAITSHYTSKNKTYADVYISAAEKNLGPAFDKVDRMAASESKSLLKRSLMVIAAELKTVKLAELGLTRINDPDLAVRYWAIKSISTPEIASQLNSGIGDTELGEQIVNELSKHVRDETSAVTLKIISDFAGKLNRSSATDLLFEVADVRIASYSDWTVEYEIMETELLRNLFDEMRKDLSKKRVEACRKFGQLLGFVMQRYTHGQEILTEVSKQRLASVMIDTEQKILRKVGGVELGIKMAIEKKESLQGAYDFILGTEKKPGQLSKEFKFDYGTDSAGNAILCPEKREMPPVPEPITEE